MLGLAVLTAIANGVTNIRGGSHDAHARLLGYRAAYYGAIGFALLGIILSLLAIHTASHTEHELTPIDNKLECEGDVRVDGGDEIRV